MKALVDLHCHTVASGHAYSTIKENIESAKEKGLKVLGISDHYEKLPGGASALHFFNLKVLKDEIDGIRILKGIEANIIDFDGTLDAPEEVLSCLDYTIASLHPPCIAFGSALQNTNAIVNAIKNKHVKIIGHLDDNRFPVNYEEVVKVAKENNVAFEINNSSLRPGSFRQGANENARLLAKTCEKYGVYVIMGSDAHIYYDIGALESSKQVLDDINFPNELVLNYNLDKFMEFILSK